MPYEIIVTVLDKRIAELCTAKIEMTTGYNCTIREKNPEFKIGDSVQYNFCDDITIFEVEHVKKDEIGRYIYKLMSVVGWKDECNLSLKLEE